MTTDELVIRCSVVRAQKLPQGVTAESICDSVRRAANPALDQAKLAPNALSVRITVESETKLTAAATLQGKSLPEHHVSISDRPLNARAVSMLANAIAADVTSARR